MHAPPRMKNVKPKTSSHIPQELMEMILSNLPVKSLKRFLTISKDWYNSITSTQFISKHLNFTNSLQDNPLLLVVFYYESDEWSYVIYSDDDNTFQDYAILEPPVPLGCSTSDLRVCGCSNGLICLSSYHQLLLWNPSLERFLRLPDSHADLRTEIRLPFGFVFDHISNDFKVLRRTNCLKEVEVFRLSTNLWEVLTKVPYEMYGSQVNLKGFAHWMGGDYGSKPIIISFDVHKEVFASIQTPAQLLEYPMDFWLGFPVCLHLFQESLVLIQYYDELDRRIMHSRRRYNFWKMEEYGNAESWNLWHTLCCYTIRTPLGFRRNGQFLWVDEDRRKFISTDLENFSEADLGESDCVNECFNYVESLALFDTATRKRWVRGVDIEEDSPPPYGWWFDD